MEAKYVDSRMDDMKKVIAGFMALSIITLVSCSNGSSMMPFLPSGDTEQGTVNATKALIEAYDGTIVKAEWVQGIAGDALLFNGSDSHVYLPYHQDLVLQHEGTLEAFILVNSHRPYAGIIHKGVSKDFSDEDYTFQFWGSDGTLLISLVNESGERLWLFSTRKIETGAWYHVAATWNADNVTLYINGEKDSSAPNTIGIVRNSMNAVILGAQLPELYNESWEYLALDGIVGEVRILPEALSADVIRDYYRSVIPEE